MSSYGQRRAFTLVELLVAMGLFVGALMVALLATVGSNGLMRRADTQGLMAEVGRDTSSALRRSLAEVNVADVNLITAASYPSSTSEQPNLTKAGPNTGEVAFAVEVQRFAADQRQNVCHLIGRAKIVDTSGSTSIYQLNPTGLEMALLIFRMNESNQCEYSTLLFKSRLSSENISMTEFGLFLAEGTYACPAGTCSVGRLRYKLSAEPNKRLEGSQTDVQRRSFTIVSSLVIGLNVNRQALLPAQLEFYDRVEVPPPTGTRLGRVSPGSAKRGMTL
jgi:type II secretory pathway pseudopilin PulG